MFNVVNGISKRPVGRSTLGKLVASTGLFIFLVSGAAYIAEQVEDGDTLTRDTEILLRINDHSSSLLDTISLFVTYSGNLLTVAIMVLILAGILLKLGKRRAVVQVLFTMGGVLFLNAILKLIFQRDRPELWQLLTHESTFSFPSGHALASAAFAMLLVLLMWKTRFKIPVIIFASMYTLSVGVSRLYLGVHYPTEVLAGWLIGMAWAVLVGMIIGSVKIRKVPSGQDS